MQQISVDRFCPSSKTCNERSWINQGLKLSEREWICKNGHHLDRDENAAKNILKEGLKIILSRTGNLTDGAPTKTSVKKRKAVKSEASPIAYGVGG